MSHTVHIASFHIPEFPAIAVQRAAQMREDVIVVQKLSVVSCSAGARARGVEIGDSSQRAERLAPDAQIVLRNYATELSVWEEVIQSVYTLTPHIVEQRVGSLLLHATNAEKLRFFAGQYHACVGIAGSALTAQVAAYSCEPDSMLFIDDSDARSFLANTSVEILEHFGIDEECREKLMLFGLGTLSMLQPITQRQLMAQFGVQGKRLYTLVQDLMADRRAALPYFLPPQPISAEERFEQAVKEPRELEAALRELIARVMHDLLQTVGRQCCWIGVRLHQMCGREARVRYARRILKQGTNSIDSIRTASEILLRSIMNGNECTELQLELGGLVMATPTQLSFLSHKGEPDEIALTVEKRYPNTMYKAQIRNANAYLAEDRFTLLAYAREELI